ncbi:MAG: hypothetical protein JNJ90_11210 [Saprospiraceae bacterium]|nr:hypothetical protein [Saprospiraceae bacterium]
MTKREKKSSEIRFKGNIKWTDNKPVKNAYVRIVEVNSGRVLERKIAVSATGKWNTKVEVPTDARIRVEVYDDSRDLLLQTIEGKPGERAWNQLDIPVEQVMQLPDFSRHWSLLQPGLQSTPLATIKDKALSEMAARLLIQEREIEQVQQLRQSVQAAEKSGVSPVLHYVFLREGESDDIKTILDKFQPDDLTLIINTAVQAQRIEAIDVDAAVAELDILRPSLSSVESLATRLGVVLTDNLKGKLEDKRIKSFADLREKGAKIKRESLSMDERRALGRLEAHSRLSLATPVLSVQQELITAGFNTLASITAASPRDMIQSVSEKNQKSAYLTYAFAQTAAAAVNNKALEEAQKIKIENETPCGCEDCKSALSPLAYLADLMNYAVRNVEVDLREQVSKGLLKEVEARGADFVANILYNYPSISKVRTKFHLFKKESPKENTKVNQYQISEPGLFDLSFLFTGEAKAVLKDGGVPVGELDKSNLGGYIAQKRVRLYKPLYLIGHNDGNNLVINLFNASTEDEISSILQNNTPTSSPFSIYKLLGYYPDSRLDFRSLEEILYQPLMDLPVTCNQMSEAVNQNRLVIEVLRAWSLDRATADEKHLKFDEQYQKYLQGVYEDLLRRMGTSYEELIRLGKVIVDQDQPERDNTRAIQALADRIGLHLDLPLKNGPIYFKDFIIDMANIKEEDLELKFGFQDTKRDPISTGLIYGAGRNRTKRWHLQNIQAGFNTDENGFLYVDFEQKQDHQQIKIYKNEAKRAADLVAENKEQEFFNPEGAFKVHIQPVNNSGLQGYFNLSAAVTADLRIATTPVLLTERRRRLRALWNEQTYPIDPYSPEWAGKREQQRRPIIDPDMIGPDDFRSPNANNTAFAIWIKRHEWLYQKNGGPKGLFVALWENFNKKEITGRSDLRVPDINRIFDQGMQRVRYDAQTEIAAWAAVGAVETEKLLREKWIAIKNERDKNKLEILLDSLWAEYRLTKEMLKRLVELIPKIGNYKQDATLTQDDGIEFVNMLIQVHKNYLLEHWIAEEASLEFSYKHFWKAQRIPKAGESYVFEGDGPMIDPETVDLKDLAEDEVASNALDKWETRKRFLETFRLELEKAPQTEKDVWAMLDRVLDIRNEERLKDNFYSWSDDPEGNSDNIQKTLKIAPEQFSQGIMPVFRKLFPKDTTIQPSAPTAAEWNEWYNTLTLIHKKKNLYRDWQNQEVSDGQKWHIWQVFKAKHPVGRADSGQYRQWQKALAQRNENPVIDPDLFPTSYLRIREDNPAIDLYAIRKLALEETEKSIVDKPEQERTLATFKPIFSEYAGLSDTTLSDLQKAREKGRNIDGRLAQLLLTEESFGLLLALESLLKNRVNISRSMWDDFAAIMTQVWKQRQVFDWKQAERDASIVLSPDYFKIPVFDPTLIPKAPEPKLLKWRSDKYRAADWVDLLDNRIEQWERLETNLRKMIDAVEEAYLPALRDNLLLNIAESSSGSSVSEKADWVIANLFINAKAGGCQKNTRIAQAISSLQGLLWGLRNGLTTDADMPLRLINRDTWFDDEWNWIGSYATWRSAVFTFVYPENILIPSLKRSKSPDFEKLIESVRGIRTLTHKKALDLLTEYEDYFNDVCNLSFAACIEEESRVWGSNKPHLWKKNNSKKVKFVFGVAVNTQKLYWSVIELYGATMAGQNYWESLDEVLFANKTKENIISSVDTVVGCTAYYYTELKKFIYLFVVVKIDREKKLKALRMDLTSGDWIMFDIEGIKFQGEKYEDDEIENTTISIAENFDINKPPVLLIDMKLKDKPLTKIQLDLDQKGETVGETVIEKQVPKVERWTSRIQPGNNTGPVVLGRFEFNRETSLGFAAYSDGSEVLICYGENETSPGGNTIHLLSQNEGWKEIKNGNIGTVGGPYFSHLGGFTKIDNHSIIYVHQYAKRGTFDENEDFSRKLFLCNDTSLTIDFDNPLAEIISYDYVGNKSGPLIDYLDKFFNPKEPNSQGHWSRITPGDVYRKDDGDTYRISRISKSSLASFKHNNINYLVIFECNYNMAYCAIGELTYTNGVPSNTENWKVLDVSALSLFTKHTGQPAAVGIAINDLDHDGNPEFVLFLLTETANSGGNPSENIGYYQVVNVEKNDAGWNLPEQKPNEAYKVGENVDDWFGNDTGGAAIAIVYDDKINGPKSRKDLLVFHTVRHQFPGDDNGKQFLYYRVGKNIDIPTDSEAPKCSTTEFERLKPHFPSDAPMKVFSNRHGVSAYAYRLTNDVNTLQINQDYLDEAFYLIPIFIAQQLQRTQQFTAALDWYRLVYDYPEMIKDPKSDKKTFDFSLLEEGDRKFERLQDWLRDPLNPHAIAANRKGTYERFTLLSVIRCLLDYADTEFTYDSPESLPRAGELYQSALQLLKNELLHQHQGECNNIIGNLEIDISDDFWSATLAEIRITEAPKPMELISVLKKDQAKLKDVPAKEALRHLYAAVDRIQQQQSAQSDIQYFSGAVQQKKLNMERSTDKILHSAELSDLLAAQITTMFLMNSNQKYVNPFSFNIGNFNSGIIARPEIPTLDKIDDLTIKPFGPVMPPHIFKILGSIEITVRNTPAFLRDGGNSSSVKPKDVINPDEGNWIALQPRLFCISPNPVIKALKIRAEVNLFKLNQCRNIAGMKREMDFYAAETDQTTGMPVIGSSGQLLLPGINRIRPSIYRYTVLIRRAEELVQLAQQVENSLLSTIQNLESEQYNLLRAKFDIQYKSATVRLKQLNVRMANDTVNLKQLQRDKSELLLQTYDRWLNEGMLFLEEEMIRIYREITLNNQNSIGLKAAAQIASTWIGVNYTDPGKVAQAFLSTGLTAQTAILDAQSAWLQGEINRLSLIRL